MKEQYREPKQQPVNFKVDYNVFISRIILVPRKLDEKMFWQYSINEVNSNGRNHLITYYSYNLLALEQHRDNKIKDYKQIYDNINKGSSAEGFEIKPTILQQIRAKNTEKIK